MAVSSPGGNGSGPNGNSQAATLADASAGDRLVKAIWAKVLGQPLPPADKPDAFVAAVDNRFTRVIEDLYGMSRIVERPTVATGAVGGYVTSAYAWTLEDTNAVTQAQYLFWVLQEISMLVSQAIPPVDLYTIAACFKRTADQIEAVRGQFLACGAPPGGIMLPIGGKSAPQVSFEEVLAGVEYLT